MLSAMHARIFLSGSDNRTILAKHVLSFAPVAQHHLFLEKDISLDMPMERNLSLAISLDLLPRGRF